MNDLERILYLTQSLKIDQKTIREMVKRYEELRQEYRSGDKKKLLTPVMYEKSERAYIENRLLLEMNEKGL